MDRRIKCITARANTRLHIETPLGIVNITVGLVDMKGRSVDAITVIPDGGVRRAGLANTRLIGNTKEDRP